MITFWIYELTQQRTLKMNIEIQTFCHACLSQTYFSQQWAGKIFCFVFQHICTIVLSNNSQVHSHNSTHASSFNVFSLILGGVDANANMDNWFVVDVSWCNYVKYDKKGERSNRARTINYFDMWLQKHDISWLVGDS